MLKQSQLSCFFVRKEKLDTSNKSISVDIPDSSTLKSPKIEKEQEIIDVDPRSPNFLQFGNDSVATEECKLCKLLAAVSGEQSDGQKFSKDSMALHLKIHSDQLRLIEGEPKTAVKVGPVGYGTEEKKMEKSVVVDRKNANQKKKSQRRSEKITNVELISVIKQVFVNLPTYATCALCLKGMKVLSVKGSSLRYREIVDHASSHLGKMLFECRHCKFEALTGYSMRGHLFKTHQQRFLPSEYVSLLGLHWLEVGEMVRRCYGGAGAQQAETVEMNNKIQRRSAPVLTSSPSTQPFKVIQLLCSWRPGCHSKAVCRCDRCCKYFCVDCVHMHLNDSVTADHRVESLIEPDHYASLPSFPTLASLMQKDLTDFGSCDGTKEKISTSFTLDNGKENTRKRKSDGLAIERGRKLKMVVNLDN